MPLCKHHPYALDNRIAPIVRQGPEENFQDHVAVFPFPTRMQITQRRHAVHISIFARSGT